MIVLRKPHGEGMDMGERPKRIFTRREFLKTACAVSSCVLMPPVLPCFGVQGSTGPHPGDGKAYYVSRRDEFTKVFDGVNTGAGQYLSAAYGEEEARYITVKAAEEFKRLLPAMPDVGGERNWVTEFIVVAGWYAAYFIPMKSLGRHGEDVGRMMYRLMEMQYSGMPRDRALAEGKQKFTALYMEEIKRWAGWTRKREYPGNWVASFVEGDGKEFDWGNDYTECGAVKYFRALGMGEVAPYMCVNDFPRSRALDTGLERTMTLAEGYPKCNFRYKRGRPVLRDWSTEIPRIRTRIREGHVKAAG
jgi:hypothetical protein